MGGRMRDEIVAENRHGANCANAQSVCCPAIDSGWVGVRCAYYYYVGYTRSLSVSRQSRHRLLLLLHPAQMSNRLGARLIAFFDVPPRCMSLNLFITPLMTWWWRRRLHFLPLGQTLT